MEPAQRDPLGFPPPSAGGKGRGELEAGDPAEVAFWVLLTPDLTPLLALWLCLSQPTGLVTGGAGPCLGLACGVQIARGGGSSRAWGDGVRGLGYVRWATWVHSKRFGPPRGSLGSNVQGELRQSHRVRWGWSGVG